MPKVVLNTTPFLALSTIGKIHLLKIFYDEIIIPQGVYNEILAGGKGRPGYEEIKSIQWIKVKKIINEKAKDYLLLEIGEGEAETIILAEEINADLVIIDDYLAREIAKMRGLKITGTLGVLIKAKNKGLIKMVRPLVDKLIKKSFWFDGKLYHLILELSGEL